MTLVTTPLEAFYCPSRRPVQTYPTSLTNYDASSAAGFGLTTQQVIIYDTSAPTTKTLLTGITACARNDYAGNASNWLSLPDIASANPTSAFATALTTAVLSGPGAALALLTGPAAENVKALIGNTDCGRGGIFVPLYPVTVAQVSDGTSNVILCGEKFVDPNQYFTGTEHGDDWWIFGGYDPETERYGYYNGTPSTAHPNLYPDTAGFWCDGFGSAHMGMCNMAFCDGSVHQISYGISGTVFGQLTNRADGARSTPACTKLA